MPSFLPVCVCTFKEGFCFLGMYMYVKYVMCPSQVCCSADLFISALVLNFLSFGFIIYFFI